MTGEAQSDGKVSITISNPMNINRADEVVAVSWAAITSKYPGIDTANFKVLNANSKMEVPFQLERKGGKEVQNLLLQLSFKPKGSDKLVIVAGEPATAVRKTFGRFVPERYDDFAWENDKVAFRMYGKALETRQDNAYGTDIWVKRAGKLVINEWYKSGDYHTDHGDGLDYYAVGLTLGGGDIAPFKNDSIYFSKNYHHWKILDNGPLRTTFELGYDEWNVDGLSVKVTKTISLDAGSNMNKIEALYSFDGANPLPLVIGIVERKEKGESLLDEGQGLMAYWEPPYKQDGTTGVGVITAKPVLGIRNSKGHFLTLTAAKKNEPVVYYNGAAWNKANEITNAQQWFSYLKNFKAKLSQPLKVTVQ
ncbi:MAG: DUF4861 domain-containing protein [Pedobacter sp.]|nr:MAG: DUF4861 domain-containing protein [Pedobacter sp.]